MGGDDPNHLDLVAFSQVALVLNVDDSENGAKCPLKEFINADCTNLVGHYNRMKDRAWGDHWDEAIGEKMELNPHIPKPDPPKEEEKVEERRRKQRTKRKTQKIRKRRTKKRPTQTKRRKRKRRRRSPSNLAQDHYINKKNLLDPIPLETLLPRPLPRPSNQRKEKDLHKKQALAHSTSFPMTSYLLGVGRSYG